MKALTLALIAIACATISRAGTAYARLLFEARNATRERDESVESMIGRVTWLAAENRRLDALVKEAQWLVEHGVPEAEPGWIRTGATDLADRCDEWTRRADAWRISSARGGVR